MISQFKLQVTAFVYHWLLKNYLSDTVILYLKTKAKANFQPYIYNEIKQTKPRT